MFQRKDMSSAVFLGHRALCTLTPFTRLHPCCLQWWLWIVCCPAFHKIYMGYASFKKFWSPLLKDPHQVFKGVPFSPALLTKSAVTNGEPSLTTWQYKVSGFKEAWLHISILELRATQLVCMSFLPHNEVLNLQLKQHGVTESSYVNKQGGTRSMLQCRKAILL